MAAGKFPFGSLSREPTEEEKAKHAERLRRLTAIANGKHPDTGRPLRPGDETTFTPTEQSQARIWRYVSMVQRYQNIADAGSLIDYLGERWKYQREFLQSRLIALAIDWQHEKNPVYAWNAYSIARTLGSDIPDWVAHYLDTAAKAIMDILDEVEDGKKIKKTGGKKTKKTERERVGKALGFGASGVGKSARFEAVVQDENDWALYFKVEDLINNGVKLDAAYSEVKEKQEVNRTTVQRAYKRIRQVIDDNKKSECS